MILQLKIKINGISKPPVWRKVLVPADFTFEKLHLVIQYAFGWGGGHLYAFTPGGLGTNPSIERVSGDKMYDSENVDMDSKKTKISKFLKAKGDMFAYTYDFGDDWEHIITVEATTTDKATHATLIGGKGKCPPDDCGGVWGYEDFLQTVNTPSHPEYKELREWVGLSKGETWNPHEFNLEDRAWLVKDLPDYGF